MRCKISHRDIQFAIVTHLSFSYSGGNVLHSRRDKEESWRPRVLDLLRSRTGGHTPFFVFEQREYRRHPRNFSAHTRECTAALHKQEGRSLSSAFIRRVARLTMLVYSCVSPVASERSTRPHRGAFVVSRASSNFKLRSNFPPRVGGERSRPHRSRSFDDSPE